MFSTFVQPNNSSKELSHKMTSTVVHIEIPCEVYYDTRIVKFEYVKLLIHWHDNTARTTDYNNLFFVSE